MTTLDDLLQQRPRVDFLKVDTDGFDFEVLRGAKRILERDAPILYFEFFPAASPTATPVADLAWLQSSGYYRFVGFTPSGDLLGATESAEQAASWASSRPYCNILVCHHGSPPEGGIEHLILQLKEPSRR